MDRLRAKVCVLALGHALLATGCAHVLGIDGDYGDQPLDGGTPAKTGEAGVKRDGSLDGRAHDAKAVDDGGAYDATAVDDARGTAGDVEPDAALTTTDSAVIEASLSFCADAGMHLVCDDFDHSAQNWKETTTAGSQQLDAVSATSPPNAYLAATNVLDGGTAKVTRSLSFPTPPSTYHFEYSLRVDACDMDSAAALATVTIKDAVTGASYSGGIVLRGAGALFEDVWVRSSTASESHVRHPLPRDIPAGEWVRVIADVAFAASGATLGLKLDGARLFDGVALQPTTVTGQTTVTIGITHLAGPASSCRVRYDDVVFDMN